MASPPGQPGKTESLVLQYHSRVEKKRPVIGVIEGDIASSIRRGNRGQRRRAGDTQSIPAANAILESFQIQNASWNQLYLLPDIDLLLIENVGNLVLPGGIQYREDLKVLIASVPEGDDKPYKYPLMFNTVDAIVLNKIDLLLLMSSSMWTAFTKTVKTITPKLNSSRFPAPPAKAFNRGRKWLQAQMKRK